MEETAIFRFSKCFSCYIDVEVGRLVRLITAWDRDVTEGRRENAKQMAAGPQAHSITCTAYRPAVQPWYGGPAGQMIHAANKN